MRVGNFGSTFIISANPIHDLSIHARGDEEAALCRVPLKACDALLVAFVNLHALQGANVPKTDQTVVGGGYEIRSVVVPANSADFILVRSYCFYTLSRFGAPHFDEVVFAS